MIPAATVTKPPNGASGGSPVTTHSASSQTVHAAVTA